ncbi:hypothetical protein [Nocardioides sp.]|uniref:hypothetical protein n=1 Tax=Nocardioides sp. TaxID=35761 RepID=UPI0035159AF0
MDLHLRRPGVVAPVRADPRGLTGPTPGQARGRRWRTSSAGRFVPAEADGAEDLQRIVEAVASAPRGCGATGWAALRWQGARWFSGRDAAREALPVPIAVGDTTHLTAARGVVVRRDWLFDGDIIDVDGLPITRPERSICVDALRARSLDDTVRVISMALADDLATLDDVAAYAERIRGRPHTRRLLEALEHSDENLWSPQEVTLLMQWRRQRPRARLHCNPPIFDRLGRHLLTPDLFDAEAGVVGQYDGRIHDREEVRRRDLVAEELCRDIGLEVVRMVSEDLRDRGAFEQRLRSAYRRAGRRSSSTRAEWTLEQPSWWVDTSTVAARRALDDDTRRRWLRHRSAG